MQRNHKYHLHYKRVKTLPRLIFYNNNNDQLRLCLFLVKITSENAFRKWGCLVGPENSIFQKLKSVDPKKKPLTTEMLLHFYFSFKAFPENERERERARARAQEEKIQSEIASSNSSPRSRSTARSRSKIAIDGAISRRQDRDLREIAPSILQSSNWKHFRRWWFFFSGLWLVFSDLCFPSFFPNTRKYFPENFLKCNQTHGNIFLFRKLAFPENMYFPENILQQPNTAYNSPMPTRYLHFLFSF